MSGMTGASMLRTRRKDVNLKPNRRLDRKSSRGMLFENEELRLRTININAEVERGQSDIKKLKRENEQLKREISALRYEYDRLDHLLRERRSSPDNSDDSASVCSACPECASVGSGRVFHDLSVVPEEGEEGNKKKSAAGKGVQVNKRKPRGPNKKTVDKTISGVESPCACDDCQEPPKDTPITKQPTSTPMTQMMQHNGSQQPNTGNNRSERGVDVLVHDNPVETPQFFQSVTSPPYHVTTPPPPGFVLAPYQPPRFHTGGNVEDLLEDVQNSPTVQTTFIQQNSVFMCNTRKITQGCCCQKQEPAPATSQNGEQPKSYVTEKNIELTYDYPRNTPIPSNQTPKNGELTTTTTEVASTVVFVERRIPVKPKKFDFFFRSRSAPVGEREEPIYATVNKLPKRLRRMELANLEKEVAYKSAEPDSSTRTDLTLKTDSESRVPPPDDDTSRSERERSTAPQRPDSPKAKRRKRFSLTFKKRERKRKEVKKESKNGVPKVAPVMVESDNERLIDREAEQRAKPCARHRPRNTLSSSSSGPRYKRDSYQEMTTSHSERERTNSVCSSVNSLASACTHNPRKLSAPPVPDGSIPWCGCWGAGCI